MLSVASPMSPPMLPVEQQSQDEDALQASAKLPDTPMQDQFMDDPFDYDYAEPKPDVEQPHLVTHVKVYAIAEK